MNNIQLGWGDQTLKGAANKFTVMLVEPCKKSRTFPSKVFTSMNKFPAKASASNRGIVHVGSVYNQSFQTNGTHYMLLSMMSTFHNVSTRNAMICLRIREDAPTLIISGKPVRHEDSSIGDRFIMFQGKADVINAEEATKLELPMNRGTLALMEDEAVEHAFEIQTLYDDRVKPAPSVVKVTNRQGETKAISIGGQRKRAVRRRTTK
jgi:hypothetical protein